MKKGTTIIIKTPSDCVKVWDDRECISIVEMGELFQRALLGFGFQPENVDELFSGMISNCCDDTCDDEPIECHTGGCNYTPQNYQEEVGK